MFVTNSQTIDMSLNAVPFHEERKMSFKAMGIFSDLSKCKLTL